MTPAVSSEESSVSMEVTEAIVPNAIETNEIVIGLLMVANVAAVLIGLVLALRWAVCRCTRWLRRR